MEFELALKFPDFSLGLHKGKRDQTAGAKDQGEERGMWFWRTPCKSKRLKKKKTKKTKNKTQHLMSAFSVRLERKEETKSEGL